MVGYRDQKALVEESLLLPLLFPDTFDSVVAGTRDLADGPAPDIRPKAILLHGAPGTGKTSCARAIAARSRLPLVYLPLEAVASKWYGEGEQKLAAVFEACGRLAREGAVQAPHTHSGGEEGSGVNGEGAAGSLSSANGHGGCVLLFLDEIDALAGARDTNSMHEATRRALSVLLRKIDGLEGDEGVVVIGATNRWARLTLTATLRVSSKREWTESGFVSRVRIGPEPCQQGEWLWGIRHKDTMFMAGAMVPPAPHVSLLKEGATDTAHPQTHTLPPPLPQAARPRLGSPLALRRGHPLPAAVGGRARRHLWPVRQAAAAGQPRPPCPDVRRVEREEHSGCLQRCAHPARPQGAGRRRAAVILSSTSLLELSTHDPPSRR